MISTVVGKGLAAGAAGTTALNAMTYADMALRGRPPSRLPERSVELAARRLGQEIPGDVDTRRHRLTGLGSLGGIGTGLGIGVVAGLAGPLVRRIPFAAAAVGVGAAAMAASDVPMTRIGLTDPRGWSTADWLADVVPHLAYGVVTAWTLRALPPARRHREAGRAGIPAAPQR